MRFFLLATKPHFHKSATLRLKQLGTLSMTTGDFKNESILKSNLIKYRLILILGL
jgi:hypothetical protein